MSRDNRRTCRNSQKYEDTEEYENQLKPSNIRGEKQKKDYSSKNLESSLKRSE